MASSRPRIFWTPLEDAGKLYTVGWLPDSDVLRWSLAAAVRVEGIREGWAPCHAASEGAIVYQAYVGENEDGEFVECTVDGETMNGEVVKACSSTIAVLSTDID